MARRGLFNHPFNRSAGRPEDSIGFAALLRACMSAAKGNSTQLPLPTAQLQTNFDGACESARTMHAEPHQRPSSTTALPNAFFFHPRYAAGVALSITAGAVTGFIAIILFLVISRYLWRLIKARLRAARAAAFSPEESPDGRPVSSPELAPVSLPVSQAVLAEFMEAGVFSPPPVQPPRSLLCGTPPSLGGHTGAVTALQVLSGAAKE
jgi:hypothetical protein